MQTLAEQPPRTHEERKSFDVCASVYRIRDDMFDFGYLQPETKEQVRNEELSYLAEGIDLASRTSFTLQRRGEDLVYFSEGKWQPYTSLLLTGKHTAEREAGQDRRRQFLYDMTVRDYYYGNKMGALKPGEQIIWDSPYRRDVEALYGRAFMQDVGMQPDRQMGFLYRAACNKDGSVTLETQSIDNSDLDAFAAVRQATVYDPQMSMSAAVRYYDGAMLRKYNKPHFAGRTEDERVQNAWESINEEADLIDFHLLRLEQLATSDLFGLALERSVTEHVLGVWGLFKQRLDAKRGRSQVVNERPGMVESPDVEYWHLLRQVQNSFHEVVRSGKMLSGCGGSLKATLDPLETDFDATKKAIFGEGEGMPESYAFKTKMFCVVCQAPPKEKTAKKMCGPCGICRDCDKKLGGKG